MSAARRVATLVLRARPADAVRVWWCMWVWYCRKCGRLLERWWRRMGARVVRGGPPFGGVRGGERVGVGESAARGVGLGSACAIPFGAGRGEGVWGCEVPFVWGTGARGGGLISCAVVVLVG